MACAFGMTGSQALGMLGHLYPALQTPLVVLITILVTMVCRFYAVPPRGSLFFVMSAAIAAYSLCRAAMRSRRWERSQWARCWRSALRSCTACTS